MSNLITKLEQYAQKNFNVLLRGRHGVGKTSIVRQIANNLGLRMHSISASTIDPWIHLVGVPEKYKNENGDEYLKMVMPEYFVKDGGIDILFIDEFNRSHKATRNACMELLQFKSINGVKIPNLKMVWVAINPDDDVDISYDVEPIDPAQLDRFHCALDIPYKPSLQYFKDVYGENIAKNAISWWNKLTDKQNRLVSPRRLDYALYVHSEGGDLSDVLPVEVNSHELFTYIDKGDPIIKLKDFIKNDNKDEIKKMIQDENMFHLIQPYMKTSKKKSKDIIVACVPFMSNEKIVKQMISDKIFRETIIENCRADKLGLEKNLFPSKNYTPQYMKEIYKWIEKTAPLSNINAQEPIEYLHNCTLTRLKTSSVERKKWLDELTARLTSEHDNLVLDNLLQYPKMNLNQINDFEKRLKLVVSHSNGQRFAKYEKIIGELAYKLGLTGPDIPDFYNYLYNNRGLDCSTGFEHFDNDDLIQET